MSLLLSPRTSKHLDLIVSNPPQGLLITGLAGSGKTTVAKLIASQVLDIPIQKLDDNPAFSILGKVDKQTEISIETIRQALAVSLKICFVTGPAGEKGLSSRLFG